MLFIFISFSLIRLPSGSDAHVNLCPPQPHLHMPTVSYLSIFKLPNNRPDCAVKHPTHSPVTNIHAHDKGTNQSLLMQHQGLMSTKRFWIPSKGSVQWGRQHLTCSLGKGGMQSLDSMSWKPMDPENSTEHKPCALLSSPGSAVFTR